MANPDNPTVKTSRRSRWMYPCCAVLLLVAFCATFIWIWAGNSLRPFLEARLSTAIGRQVAIQRLDVRLGHMITLSSYGVSIANPPGFQGGDFMVADRISVNVDILSWLQANRVARAEVDHPVFNIIQNDSGQGNWLTPNAAAGVEIHELIVENGTAHAVSAIKNADITATLSTENGGVNITGQGTYLGQPVAFHGTAGNLLALNDTAKPYPVDFQATTGKTSIALKGDIHDLFAIKSADVDLSIAGPDLSLLGPLTGFATPRSPPYDVSAHLNFADHAFAFAGMKGKAGSSDLQGELRIDLGKQPALVTGAFTSEKLELQDLLGFFGAGAGQKTALQPRAADVHITLRGDKVAGRPFDSISLTLNKAGGQTHLSPVQFGIAGGSLIAAIDITPAGDNDETTDADIKVERVDVSKLLRPFGFGGDGDGLIYATATVKAQGKTLPAILASADGEVRASMPPGGYISSELINMLGVEVGRALFDELGVPDRERITCLVADFTLQRGTLISRELELDTTNHLITGGGRVDLAREVMAITLRADPKHFTVGTLASPIVISGPFSHLHVAPTKELAERGGFVAALGVLFPPAALLPTIRFGVGDHSPCAERKSR